MATLSSCYNIILDQNDNGALHAEPRRAVEVRRACATFAELTPAQARQHVRCCAAWRRCRDPCSHAARRPRTAPPYAPVLTPQRRRRLRHCRRYRLAHPPDLQRHHYRHLRAAVSVEHGAPEARRASGVRRDWEWDISAHSSAAPSCPLPSLRTSPLAMLLAPAPARSARWLTLTVQLRRNHPRARGRLAHRAAEGPGALLRVVPALVYWSWGV